MLGCEGGAADCARALAARTGAARVVVSDGTEAVVGFEGASGALHAIASRETVVLDRAGAGDALVAGTLHALLDDRPDFARGLALGQTLAAMAVSQFGDRVVTTAAELEAIAEGATVDIER